jgi:hypothetical protein
MRSMCKVSRVPNAWPVRCACTKVHCAPKCTRTAPPATTFFLQCGRLGRTLVRLLLYIHAHVTLKTCCLFALTARRPG